MKLGEGGADRHVDMHYLDAGWRSSPYSESQDFGRERQGEEACNGISPEIPLARFSIDGIKVRSSSGVYVFGRMFNQ